MADAQLKNYVDHLFKGTVNEKRIGDGTTMDAIRAELATGLDTHGKLHITKGSQILRGLERWLRMHPEASSDRDIASSLVTELKDVLNR